MDKLTTALESLGLLLVVLAVGWQTAILIGVPLGLCATAVLLWLASWVLQACPMPGRKRKAKTQ